MVTCVVKVEFRLKLRHADHLIHSAVADIHCDLDVDDVPDLTSASAEPEITGSVTRPNSVPAPL